MGNLHLGHLYFQGTDGFFVVPYDQPPSLIAHECKDTTSSRQPVFKCKYILGLDLLGGDSSTKCGQEQDSGQNSAQSCSGRINWEDGHDGSGSLRSILVAECKNNESLAMVPKGSVKVVRKESRPKRQTSSNNSSDWFRKEDVIVEEEEENIAEAPGPPDHQGERNNDRFKPDSTISKGVTL
mmetsp:Transcript_20352/g.29816  ORF Transcript_20352/g.29816 Transcript_20352/m.29816 type:complete len:182 (+) Transcript_20352:1132-1677(+)